MSSSWVLCPWCWTNRTREVAEVNSTKSLLIKRILQGRFLQGHVHLVKKIRMITSVYVYIDVLEILDELDDFQMWTVSTLPYKVSKSFWLEVFQRHDLWPFIFWKWKKCQCKSDWLLWTLCWDSQSMIKEPRDKVSHQLLLERSNLGAELN